MSNDRYAKCANPQCSCVAAAGSLDCSPPCEGAEQTHMTEIGCGCGHAVCTGKVSG